MKHEEESLFKLVNGHRKVYRDGIDFINRIE
jgi:hypothetical protein